MLRHDFFCGLSERAIKKFKSLRKILQNDWPNTIANTELLKRTGQMQRNAEIKSRKWRWMRWLILYITSRILDLAVGQLDGYLVECCCRLLPHRFKSGASMLLMFYIILSNKRWLQWSLLWVKIKKEGLDSSFPRCD